MIGEHGQFGFIPLTEPQRFESHLAQGLILKGAVLKLASGALSLRTDADTVEPVGVAMSSGSNGDMILVCTDENVLYKVSSDIIDVVVPSSIGKFFAIVGNTAANSVGNASNATIDGATGVTLETSNKVFQLVSSYGSQLDDGTTLVIRIASLNTSS